MFVNILKFILGITLAIAVLAGGGVAAALYLMNRNAILPAKPVFTNDNPSVKAQAKKIAEEKANAKSKVDSDVQSTPKPSPTPKKSVEPKLPPGAYKARVTWSQGLSLRSQPTLESERVGGVGFNSEVIVLSTSDDKSWQKIRILSTKQEAWVKAGNTKKVEE
ncbi:MAG: SH3 domain-containing protein [Mastigocoleus sp.]